MTDETKWEPREWFGRRHGFAMRVTRLRSRWWRVVVNEEKCAGASTLAAAKRKAVALTDALRAELAKVKP